MSWCRSNRIGVSPQVQGLALAKIADSLLLLSTEKVTVMRRDFVYREKKRFPYN